MERGRVNTASKQLTNYYQLLGIKKNADLDAVETAYARMALKYHPDVAGDAREVQEKFATINEAYSVLSKPLKRHEYDEKMASSGIVFQEEVISSDEGRAAEESVASSKAAPAKTQPESKARSKTGGMSRKRLEGIRSESRKQIAKGNFWRADALLRKAVQFYPRDIGLRKLLAKAAAGRGRLREAVEELKIASEVEYFNPEIHYLMGNMYLQGNQVDRAAESYNNALSWQEDYKPAKRGLEKIRALKKSKLPWWKKALRMRK